MITPSQIATIISLMIAILGFAASVYYSNKNVKREDKAKIAAETERNVTINFKLDAISENLSKTSSKLDKLQSDIESMRIQNNTIQEQHKELTKRVDKLETNLEKLHKEHREHMAEIREGKVDE